MGPLAAVAKAETVAFSSRLTSHGAIRILRQLLMRFAMKLPENTVFAPEKFLRYLLIPRPADDKSKFLATAGYSLSNWQALERDLREQILVLDATEIEQTKHGIVYEILGILVGPNGQSLSVTAIWMTESATGKTKFITLYPTKGKKP